MGHNNFRPHTCVPFYDRPITARRSQRCSAKSADERMAGTGRQSEPPCGDVPDGGSDHRAENRRHRDHVGVHEPFDDHRSNRAAKQHTGKIEKRCHGDRFARRQGSRRDHRGDRIGSVVKTVAAFENDRGNDDRKKVSISRSRLRILQRHFEDDISRIPAAFDHFFHQLEQIAQKIACFVLYSPW